LLVIHWPSSYTSFGHLTTPKPTLTSDLRPLTSLLVALVAASLTRADDAAFLDGMRRRQEFAQAEAHCRSLLARPSLPPRQRAELTVELSRTLVEHALASPPDDRDRLWRQAEQTTTDFLTRDLLNPRRPIVQLADALVPLTRGEAARHEAETFAPATAPAPIPATSIADLRSATDKLSTLARDIATALRQRHKKSASSPDDLSAAELQSMARHVEFHTARAAMNIALCYPAGATDRADALGQSLSRLDSLAASTSPDEIVWRSRLERIRCLRLLGRFESASQDAAALAKQSVPPALRLPLATEQARLMLAQGKFDPAIQQLDAAHAGVPLAHPLPPDSVPLAPPVDRADADLARLEVLLAAWRKSFDANQHDEAAKKQQQSVTLVREMATRHSPYWARRARFVLAGTLARDPGSRDVTVQSALAEQLWHAGRWSEALVAYDRAIEQARKPGVAEVESSNPQPDQLFQLALAAAAIEASRGTPSRAIDRYRQAALAAPKHAAAPRAHLQAAWLAAKHKGPKSDEYGALLKEHLAHWPAGPTSKEATLWLARWKEFHRDPLAEATALAAAGKRGEALAAYKKLADAHPDDGDLQRTYGRLLLAANDHLAAALEQWRLIERKSRPGTPEWFEAKYSIALAHERAGDKTQAARIVTLLAALHPDLGGPEQAAKFRNLLARCRPL
jgi:tetratricopeptide (TPR) repeat protein